MTAHRCDCGAETVYQMMSGGREFYCPACGNNGDYPEVTEENVASLPRAVLLQTPEGRIALKAAMDQELARLRSKP